MFVCVCVYLKTIGFYVITNFNEVFRGAAWNWEKKASYQTI